MKHVNGFDDSIPLKTIKIRSDQFVRESKGAEDENLVKLKKHYILPAKIANKKLAKKKKNYSARTRVANLIFWRQLLVTNLTCMVAHKPQPKRQF